MLSERVQTFVSVVVASCAILTTGMVVARELKPAAGSAIPEIPAAKVAELIASAPHVWGPSDADVTIVEFFDFQCPACRMFAASLDSVRADKTLKLRIARHHFPLSRIHPSAQDLALAGLCLKDTEDFEAYYHRAFEMQTLLAGAGTIGPMSAMPARVDTAAVRRCMGSEATWQKLSSELALGEELRIEGTPSVLIDGKLYWGAMGSEQIKRRLLEAKR